MSACLYQVNVLEKKRPLSRNYLASSQWCALTRSSPVSIRCLLFIIWEIRDFCATTFWIIINLNLTLSLNILVELTQWNQLGMGKVFRRFLSWLRPLLLELRCHQQLGSFFEIWFLWSPHLQSSLLRPKIQEEKSSN